MEDIHSGYFSSLKIVMSLLDTHYYDGKLPVAELKREIDRVAALSREMKVVACTSLLNLDMDPRQKRNLETIILDFRDASRTNYDPTNDLDAGDLLYLCYERIADADFVALFLLQLQDMSTGMCPQGRTTRLFQVLLMTNSH